jgi:hypothetical protein
MKNGFAGAENRERFYAFSATGKTDSELFRYKGHNALFIL